MLAQYSTVSRDKMERESTMEETQSGCYHEILPGGDCLLFSSFIHLWSPETDGQGMYGHDTTRHDTTSNAQYSTAQNNIAQYRIRQQRGVPGE